MSDSYRKVAEALAQVQGQSGSQSGPRGYPRPSPSDGFARLAYDMGNNGDPMTQSFAQDRVYHDLMATGFGMGSAVNGMGALLDPEPVSKAALGTVAVGTGALALDHLHKADRALRGQNMWGNTGLPGRPLPREKD